MTYLVLARKWRPRSFDTLVGQDHVVRALTHALSTQRLHHAWLFTGTRGVGKTTLSRILAKSLNCHDGITASPCGECAACAEIDSGRFVDYIELDAASNRGVEEMTQLLEQAVYAPSGGRFKVYMIDEVHMLSGHAFNAMLKTLEEPPPHVKFILATTDPQKIPVTVLSRCLQFNLKQMTAEAIISYLEMVLQQEQIHHDVPALRLLAKAAAGSMRDALSLTDQAIAYSAGQLTAEAIQGMLGTIDQGHLTELLHALGQGSAPSVVKVADDLAMRGLSYSAALADMASLLSRIAIEQRIPGSAPADDPLHDDIRALATDLHPDVVQLFYSVAVHSRHELSLAPDEYAGFVMACLRMLALVPPGTVMPQGHDGAVFRSGSESQAISRSGAQATAQPDALATSQLEPQAESQQAPMPVPSSVETASSGVEASEQALMPVPSNIEAVPEPAPSASVADDDAEEAAAPDASQASHTSQPEPASGGVSPDASPVKLTAEVIPAAARHNEQRNEVMSVGASSVKPRDELSSPPQAAPLSVSPGTGIDVQSAPPDETGAGDVPPWESLPPPDDVHELVEDDSFQTLDGLPEMGAAIAGLAPRSAQARAPRLKRMNAKDWPALVAKLPLTGVAAEIARQSEWLGSSDNCIRLRMAIPTLGETSARARLRTVLSEHFGTVIELDIEYGETGDDTAHAIEQAHRANMQRQAEQAVQHDPFVNALISEFGGQLISGSVRAL